MPEYSDLFVVLLGLGTVFAGLLCIILLITAAQNEPENLRPHSDKSRFLEDASTEGISAAQADRFGDPSFADCRSAKPRCAKSTEDQMIFRAFVLRCGTY